MNEIDRDALTRALVACRGQSAARAEQIDAKLRDEPWQEVAEFAAYSAQNRSLGLLPWEMPPCKTHLESALREPFGDPRGAREAGEVLKKLLALGLSKFESDPLAAIAQAEQRQAAK